MAAEDPLFELIKSLSQTEKRYFKRFSTLHSSRSKNNYLELFEAMDRLDQYDEGKIRRRLSNKKFASNLAVGKNYLYNLVLRSLRLYHAEQRALFQVLDLIQDIHLLIDKNLPQQAVKRIQKARRMAEQYHLELPMLEILRLERMMIRWSQKKKSQETLETNQEETARYLRQVNLQFDILKLYDDIFLILRNRPQFEHPEERIHELIRAFSERVSIADFSFETRMIYHLIWSNYYQLLTGEMKEARHHLGVLIDLFEAESHLIREYPVRYINLLSNYLTTHMADGNYEAFPVVIEKLEDLPSDREYLRIKLFQKISHFQLIYHLRTGRCEAALELIPGIERGLEKYREGISLDQQLNFYQNMAQVYFFNHQYEKALTWLDRVLHEEKHEIRQDIQLNCRLLQLLSHYELGNLEFAGSLARSVYRHVRKATSEEHLVKAVANTILKAVDLPAGERPVLLNALRKEGQAAPRSEVKEMVENWLNA